MQTWDMHTETYILASSTHKYTASVNSINAHWILPGNSTFGNTLSHFENHDIFLSHPLQKKLNEEIF